MTLVGIGTAFLGAAAADLLGDDRTRWFTRRAFGVVALAESGLTLDAVAGAAGSLPL